jgi:hypothetical protein
MSLRRMRIFTIVTGTGGRCSLCPRNCVGQDCWVSALFAAAARQESEPALETAVNRHQFSCFIPNLEGSAIVIFGMTQ